jgi:integrase
MSRGGSRPEAFPWGQVRADRRAQKFRDALDRDPLAPEVWALVRYHLLTWGRSGERTSEHTLRAYHAGVRTFLRFIEREAGPRRSRALLIARPPADLGVRYLRSLERAGLSAATVNHRRAAARALYRALRWANVTTADPFLDAPATHDPTNRADKRTPYTDDDITRLRLRITDEGSDAALEAMVLLGAHGALRIAEAAALAWEDVDSAFTAIRVRGKGGKTAAVALTRPLRDALLRLEVSGSAHRARVLPYPSPASIRYHLRRLCARAGVPYRGYHALRHYAGTRLYQQTGDLHITAAHLRHASINTTTVYAHLGANAVRARLSGWE